MEVRYGLGDLRGGSGRVGLPLGRFGTGRFLLGRSGTGCGTLGVVRDGSLDPWVGKGRVGGPLGRSRTG